MIKILLLATRNYSIEKIKSLLPPGVQVRSAILDGSPSIRFDTAFSPDIIIVQVDNVSRTFTGENTVTALQDISFTLQKGEFLCIVGQSGCGK
ncbi:MAG: hypothetical protein II799_06925, partial [Lachnospiraceae bacterium]|nr:hypothetical protein [Lachnospiraceae bacterium]